MSGQHFVSKQKKTIVVEIPYYQHQSKEESDNSDFWTDNSSGDLENDSDDNYEEKREWRIGEAGGSGGRGRNRGNRGRGRGRVGRGRGRRNKGIRRKELTGGKDHDQDQSQYQNQDQN